MLTAEDKKGGVIMKIVKKVLCVLLSVLLLMPMAVNVLADEQSCPVVFVAGYTSSKMWINRGTEDEMCVWKQDIAEKLKEAILNEIPGIIGGAGSALAGDWSDIFATLKPYADEVLEYLRLNDDGTSKYDVELYPHSVADTRLDALKKRGYLPDADALKAIGAVAGDKNVYCCTLDWRLGQIDCAAVLNEYVDNVLEATGAKKVSLYGVSFGGQVVASYLSLYGGSKANNVVLHSPALDGTTIVSQLISGDDFSIAWSDALRLYEAYDKTESDYASLTELVNLGFLDGFIGEFIDYFVLDFFTNFGSIWDLVPLNEYEELKNSLLNDGTHDLIIEKSDKYHYEIAANREKDFARLKSEGVDIFIVAGYGYEPVVTDGSDSDGVINLASATGATVANVGKNLKNDYTPVNCGIEGHHHLSAANTVDAATGYLPERTWYVKDLLHGLGFLESKVTSLMNTLLLTDDIQDVHSSTKYPQFLSSQNKCCGVYCEFSSCAEGFLTKYSTELTVTNLSKTDSITVDGIFCKGASLTFGYSFDTVIAPGEKLVARVYGPLPSENLSVQVNYITSKEDYSVGRSRTQNFLFASGSLLNEVLTVEPDGDTAEISDGIAVKEGTMTFETFFARLVYYIYKALTALLRVVGI